MWFLFNMTNPLYVFLENICRMVLLNIKLTFLNILFGTNKLNWLYSDYKQRASVRSTHGPHILWTLNDNILKQMIPKTDNMFALLPGLLALLFLQQFGVGLVLCQTKSLLLHGI